MSRSTGDRIEHAIEAHADSAVGVEDDLEAAEKTGSLRKTAFWLGITGVSLYLVAPSLLDVLGSWRDLTKIEVWWFPILAGLQLLTLACVWVLQRLALPGAPISAVIESQLAGNALGKIAPGGGALGSALQYKMLVERGASGPPVVAALTAVNVLTFAVVLALPVLALPALVGGGVDRGLLEASIISMAVFVVLAALGTVMMQSDAALNWVGRAVQSIRNRMRRNSPPLTGLCARLRNERDRLKTTLGVRWKPAVLSTVGRWAFDYAILLVALAGVDSHPLPGLVLLAFCTAQVLSQIPVTPGGLGFVEAGMTATLALAGVGAGDAVLATFIYRLFTYWLPLPVGLAAFGLHKRRAANARQVPPMSDGRRRPSR
jgi:putative heme transporter